MPKTKKIPLKVELAAPAGDWPCLYSAIEAGADAVYFGVKELNMRHAAPNFDILEIKKVMALLHKNNKRGYLTLNTIVYERELNKLRRILKEAKTSGVDAVIAWDMAVLQAAIEQGIPVHLSTQASVSNFSAVKFYASLGVKRIVLARECRLSDIEDIIRKIKTSSLDCQIEAFIHGAVCVSLSGRCLFSHHFFGKSANRGECFQPCRRQYLIKDAEQGKEYILGENYVLSAKDLCTIEIIDKLIKAGISAFKIEGRMRPAEYTKVVTSVYREAIDAFYNKRLTNRLKISLRERLDKIYNRGFDSGFYLGPPGDSMGKIGTAGYEKVFLGSVVNFYAKIKVAEILIRNNSVSKGDEVLVYGKNTPVFFAKVKEMQIEHRPVELAQRGDSVGIKLPFAVKPKDKVFLWKNKE
ncbi:MAG: peptidase U32 family protein [Candidatus Omnitrophota bacterium]